jgi:hypothetical protein
MPSMPERVGLLQPAIRLGRRQLPVPEEVLGRLVFNLLDNLRAEGFSSLR